MMNINAEDLYKLLIKYEKDDLIEIRNYPDLKDRIEKDLQSELIDSQADQLMDALAELCPHGYGFVEYCPSCKDRKNDSEELASYEPTMLEQYEHEENQ